MSIARLMQMAAAGVAPEPEIGDPFEGGFYAGNIIQGGIEYRIIVAPKASGESFDLLFKTSNTASPAATQTLNNGPAATAAMVSAGSHPAASFCAALTIGGFSDWYLPARDELELLYRNLKPSTSSNDTSARSLSAITYPEGNDVSGDTMGINRNSSPTGAAYASVIPTQTQIANFMQGGAESFSTIKSDYRCSSEFANFGAWTISFLNGGQFNDSKGSVSSVRAVRRVAV